MIWYFSGFPLTLPELKWLLIGERLGDGYTMYSELYDTTGPLSVLVYKWLNILFGRVSFPLIVCSTLLITVQAGILNNILLRNKAYDENNYLPAFFYVLLVSSIPDFFSLSPQLMSLTFLLLALNHIFRRIDNVITDELFLLAGVYLGLATFFYLPAILYSLVFLLSFVLFSSAIFRRLLLFIYGAGVVFVLVWAYFFWFGAGDDFMTSFFVYGVAKSRIYFLTYKEMINVSYALFAVALLSFSVLFTVRVTNFQQKMQQVMVLFFLGGLSILLITRELMVADLLFFVPTVAFFLVYYFLNLRRRIWKLLLPYLMMALLIGYPFWWFGRTTSGFFVSDEPEYAIENRKLMGIGTPLPIYLNNHFSGPFLDGYSSLRKIERMNDYAGASEFFGVLHKSDPEVILDELDVMPRIQSLFPEVEKRYRETDEGRYEKISN